MLTLTRFPKPRLQSAAFSTNAAAAGKAWANFVTSGGGGFRIYGIEVTLQTAVASFVGLVRTSDNGTPSGGDSQVVGYYGGAYTSPAHPRENARQRAPAYQPDVFLQWSVEPTALVYNSNLALNAWQRKRSLAAAIGQSFLWEFPAGFDVRTDAGDVTQEGVALINYGAGAGAILDVSYWFELTGNIDEG